MAGRDFLLNEERTMWNENNAFGDTTSWFVGTWHWTMSFHSILTTFFLAITIFVGVAIIRDWRRGRSGDSASRRPETSYAPGNIDRSEHLEKNRDVT